MNSDVLCVRKRQQTTHERRFSARIATQDKQYIQTLQAERESMLNTGMLTARVKQCWLVTKNDVVLQRHTVKTPQSARVG